MKIVTLGNCCKKSQKNHENAVMPQKTAALQNLLKALAICLKL